MTTNKRHRGYSTKLVAAVEAANPDLLWIKFAKFCIEQEVPVRSVAESFAVTPATVYSWFTGRATPRGRHFNRMARILDRHYVRSARL